MKDKYVVGLGEALWDVLPDGKKLGGARRTSLTMPDSLVSTPLL